MSPTVAKSSRHSKITGDFAEHLVLYWLSKYGFECARVDHVGLDLIAKNPISNVLMGISVKARSRNVGTEGTYLSIPVDNIEKIKSACAAFGCDPFFALVIDENDQIDVFVISLEHLLKIRPPGRRVIAWQMGKKSRELYSCDNEIIKFSFKTSTISWW